MDDNNKKTTGKKRVKFRSGILSAGKGNAKWIVTIIFSSFMLSAIISLFSLEMLKDINQYIAIAVVLIIIAIGIFSDIIGTAATAADEPPFHAMAAKKFYGARSSIMLIRNASKVSSICSDVVGDICGIISGTASAYIVLGISEGYGPTFTAVAELVVTGLVAAITIGGKAFGKTIAIKNSNYIIYRVGVIYEFFTGRNSFWGKIKKERK